MKLWVSLVRIADALERLGVLWESYMQQQSLRVPPRSAAPNEAPEPGSISYYDPLREARLEARAEELLLNDRARDYEDAYEKATAEERSR